MQVSWLMGSLLFESESSTQNQKQSACHEGSSAPHYYLTLTNQNHQLSSRFTEFASYCQNNYIQCSEASTPSQNQQLSSLISEWTPSSSSEVHCHIFFQLPLDKARVPKYDIQASLVEGQSCYNTGQFQDNFILLLYFLLALFCVQN